MLHYIWVSNFCICILNNKYIYLFVIVTGLADWMGDKMRVKKQVCFKFFERALESIGDHLEELMKKPECNGADTILMVGGFSESPLLQEYVIKRYIKLQVIRFFFCFLKV